MNDSTTPRGLPYLAHGDDTATRIAFATNTRQLETPKKCVVDYLFGKGKELWVAEIKTRELELRVHNNNRTLYDPKLKKFYADLLVSHHKVKDGLQVARLLCAPFHLFVKLIESDTIIYWELTDPVVQKAMTITTTKTQKNVNGGTKVEPNAFLPLDMAKVLNETSW